MKIRKLQLKNIGVFDDETIEFQPCPAKDKAEIHIFTGQNGSGKSTILATLASTFDKIDHGFSLYSLKNSLGKRFRLFNPPVEGEITNNIFVIFEDDTKSNIGLRYGQGISWLEPSTIGLSTSSERNYFVDKYYFHKLESYRMYVTSLQNSTHFIGKGLSFATFAYSGYRQITEESIEAIKEPKDFNPLSQSLNFVKNYSHRNEITINQLITNNISKSAIEKDRNEERSKKFANVIKSIEQAISKITDWRVEFDLETEPTKLVTKVNGEELDFDVLPDGLRSLISWIADLAGRVDMLKWQDDLPIFEKNLILLLDEIEVHLHPEWQRKVLPVVQKLFKNAQIFVSTHSPFVVNSVDDAWVYKLKLEDGKAKVESVTESEDGYSYETVLREIFDIYQRFGGKTQEKLESFLKDSRSIYRQNGNGQINKEQFLEDAKNLASESAELQSVVFIELAKLSKKTGETYEI